MNNEIEEIAKAGQEIAKTTSKGIEATEKLGGFLAKYVNEPFETITGMISDKLHYVRWERQLRLHDRAKEKIKERRLEDSFRVVPPKLALPIIENASLEENDELQDLWANLLVSALDPNFDGKLRTAFIDILKQLEIVDVHILNFVYSNYKEFENDIPVYSENKAQLAKYKRDEAISNFYISKNLIMKELKVEPNIYKSSVDNLIRVRCITSFIQQKEIKKIEKSRLSPAGIESIFNKRINQSENVTFDHQYDLLRLTSLGLDFIESCVNSNK